MKSECGLTKNSELHWIEHVLYCDEQVGAISEFICRGPTVLLKQLLRSTYFSIFHLSESSPGLSSVGRRAVSAEYSKNRWRLS